MFDALVGRFNDDALPNRFRSQLVIIASFMSLAQSSFARGLLKLLAYDAVRVINLSSPLRSGLGYIFLQDIAPANNM